MQTGRIKYWSPKGFGFAVVDGSKPSDPTVFVHARQLNESNITNAALEVGQRLKFETEMDPHRSGFKPRAFNITLIN